MDIILISLIIQSIIAIVALITLIIIYRLNQRIILNEVVKQERELRIKLFDYKQLIDDRRLVKNKRETLALNHDTLLFNYYEYLAICVYKKFVKGKDARLYFNDLLKATWVQFKESILFSKGFAEKEQYRVLNWLFKKWEV